MEITNLHSEILDENRISLLRKIAGGLPFDFYMAELRFLCRKDIVSRWILISSHLWILIRNSWTYA